MRWRPIKSAPKDRDILLSYEGADHKRFANQGRWIDVPHQNELEAALRDGKPVSQPPWHPGWRIGYVAILQHGGAFNGYSYEARSWLVFPTHWMPLPEPAKS